MLRARTYKTLGIGLGVVDIVRETTIEMDYSVTNYLQRDAA